MQRRWFAHLTQALPRLRLSSATDDKKIVSYLYIHLSFKVLYWRRRVSSRRPMYLLIVGSYYCVMRFINALHMRQQNPVLFEGFSPACTLSFRACYRSHLPLLHHASLPLAQNSSVQTSIPGQPLRAPRWCFCVARKPHLPLPSENPHFCQITVWTLGCIVFDDSWLYWLLLLETVV